MPEGFAKRHISDAENRLRLLLCIDALGLCTREELWPFVAKLELMEYMPMCLYLDELLRDGSLMEGQYAVQGVLFLTGGGREALELFQRRMPRSDRDRILLAAPQYAAQLSEKRQIRTAYELADLDPTTVCFCGQDIALLRKLRAVPGVKKVFVRSGVRFDYVLCDKNSPFLSELVQYHISGQLKVAPEHCVDTVLGYMGKPSVAVYERFLDKYHALNARYGKAQFVVPYLMSSHPGSRMEDAVALALYLKAHNARPEQVQDFYPTPGTISTCMYHTGIDPITMKDVYVPTDAHEKAMQRALLQYTDPKNARLVREALAFAGREDLIGYGGKCLVRPAKGEKPSDPGEGKEKNHGNKKHPPVRVPARNERGGVHPHGGGQDKRHAKGAAHSGNNAPSDRGARRKSGRVARHGKPASQDKA